MWKFFNYPDVSGPFHHGRFGSRCPDAQTLRSQPETPARLRATRSRYRTTLLRPPPKIRVNMQFVICLNPLFKFSWLALQNTLLLLLLLFAGIALRCVLVISFIDLTNPTTAAIMKTSLAIMLCAAASIVSAGIVITPIQDDQVVGKTSGDCFFGVVTPQGCG